MAGRVHQEEHLVAYVVMVWHKDAGPMEQKAIDEELGIYELAGSELLQQALSVMCSHYGLPDSV
jgi:hypothetical protein